MIKFSVAIAVVGLALLLLSALPGRLATSAAPAVASTAIPAISPPGGYSQAEVDYGRALFSAKGCVTCHHHAAIAGSGFGPESQFPDLTIYRWNADYLRSWLKDPTAIKPGTEMPDLGLKQDEIEALIAFLSAGTSGVTR